MKFSLTLFIASLIQSFFALSQDGVRTPGDVIVSDDFSTPENWIIYTEDDAVPAWEIIDETPLNISLYMFGGDEIDSPTAENGFAVLNAIDLHIETEVEPINALLEYGESFDFSDITGVIVEFYIAYRAFYNDSLFLEFTTDDWETFETIHLYSEKPANEMTTPEILPLDLSLDVAGMSNVKFRFRFKELMADPDDGAGYGAVIDDFVVKEAWSYDQKITASYHRSGLGVSHPTGLSYYKIPYNQLTGIHFSAKNTNVGGMEQPNAKLNVEVSGAETFYSSSTPVDLPISGSDSLSCTDTFIPTTEGTYYVKYFFDCDETEEETSNDTLYDSFEVMPYYNPIYARDNGIASGFIDNIPSNDGNPFLIGNIFDIVNYAVIGFIDIAITNDITNVDQLIFVQLMVLDEDSDTYVYSAQSEDLFITHGNNGSIIRLMLESNVNVNPGNTILVLAGHYGGTDEVRFKVAQKVDENTVLAYTYGAEDPVIIPSPSAVMIRPILEPRYDNIDEELSKIFSIAQNSPNPFSTNTVINYELNEGANVSIEIIDVTGKLVMTINQGTQGAGEYSLKIDANDFAEGVYFYTFTAGDSQSTKRMVITK